MTEIEGVIKFNLTFQLEELVGIDVVELSQWRSKLKERGLLGQVQDRYEGYGFGNISQRTAGGFVISGTQTGVLESVTLSDYALCESWDLKQNAINSRGTTKPSSESLSHASIYDVHESAICALHAHSPDIWSKSIRLGIAVTDESVPYGTPEMAKEVRRVIAEMSCPGIFSMGGHEDGVFTFGKSLEEAGKLMLGELARSKTLC